MGRTAWPTYWDRAVQRGAKLLDELRRTRAQLVGFAEPSVFFRAFKRWTGETPADFRGRSRGSHR